MVTDNEELGIIDEVTFTMGIVVAKAIPVFVVATVTVFVVVRMMLPGLVVLIDRLTLLRVAFCLLVLINYFGRGLCPSMTVMFAVGSLTVEDDLSHEIMGGLRYGLYYNTINLIV